MALDVFVMPLWRGKSRTQEDTARMVAGSLHDICVLSVEHGLPAIFYG